MGDLEKSGVDAMRDLLAQLDARLRQNPDYIAAEALREALRKIPGTPENAFGKPGITLQVLNAGRKLSYSDQALAVLKRYGKPLSLAAIVNRMRRWGIDAGADELAPSLSSTLSRDDRFQSVVWDGRRRWWLSDVDLPPEPVRNALLPQIAEEDDDVA